MSCLAFSLLSSHSCWTCSSHTNFIHFYYVYNFHFFFSLSIFELLDLLVRCFSHFTSSNRRSRLCFQMRLACHPRTASHHQKIQIFPLISLTLTLKFDLYKLRAFISYIVNSVNVSKCAGVVDSCHQRECHVGWCSRVLSHRSQSSAVIASHSLRIVHISLDFISTFAQMDGWNLNLNISDELAH